MIGIPAPFARYRLIPFTRTTVIVLLQGSKPIPARCGSPAQSVDPLIKGMEVVAFEPLAFPQRDWTNGAMCSKCHHANTTIRRRLLSRQKTRSKPTVLARRQRALLNIIVPLYLTRQPQLSARSASKGKDLWRPKSYRPKDRTIRSLRRLRCASSLHRRASSLHRLCT
jgi:hypothetical protein